LAMRKVTEGKEMGDKKNNAKERKPNYGKQ
jgi:hypothetical protein